MITVFFFPNGTTGVTGDDGKQIPALQRSWVLMFAAALMAEGIDPADLRFKLPDGKSAKVFLVDGVLNYDIQRFS